MENQQKDPNTGEMIKVKENQRALDNIKPYHVLFKIPVQEFIKNPNLGENNPGY